MTEKVYYHAKYDAIYLWTNKDVDLEELWFWYFIHCDYCFGCDFITEPDNKNLIYLGEL